MAGKSEVLQSDGDARFAELAHRLKEDDQTVLEAILRLLGPRVLAVFRLRYRGLLDEWDLEEVISTALFQLWTNRSKYDPKHGSLSAWFYVIARNIAVNQLRQKNKRFAMERIPLDLVAHSPSRETPSVTLRSDVGRFEVQCLQKAFADLPIVDQKILLAQVQATEEGENSWAGPIATELKIRPETVRVRCTRIRQKLKAQMREMGCDI